MILEWIGGGGSIFYFVWGLWCGVVEEERLMEWEYGDAVLCCSGVIIREVAASIYMRLVRWSKRDRDREWRLEDKVRLVFRLY